MRRELEHRFGAVGKTERVFQVWREETRKLQRAQETDALATDVAWLSLKADMAREKEARQQIRRLTARKVPER